MTRSIPRPAVPAVILAIVAALAALVLVLTGHGGIAGESALRSAVLFFTFVH